MTHISNVGYISNKSRSMPYVEYIIEFSNYIGNSIHANRLESVHLMDLMTMDETINHIYQYLISDKDVEDESLSKYQHPKNLYNLLYSYTGTLVAISNTYKIRPQFPTFNIWIEQKKFDIL